VFLGLLPAYVGVRLLLWYGASKLPRLDRVPFDANVLLFALAVLLATSVLVGIAPALRLAATNITTAMNGTEGASPQGGPLQQGELMPESENFRRELDPRADRGPKRGQQRDEQRSHSARERYQSLARNRNSHNTYRIFSRDS